MNEAIDSRIIAFIHNHHVMTMATVRNAMPQCCNLFFVYDQLYNRFIVASDEKTEHISNAIENDRIAGAIVLESTTVGKLQGLQFKGTIRRSDSEEAAAYYFKAFPYARVMMPALWEIIPSQMKLTDNRLGFGKKVIWQAVSA